VLSRLNDKLPLAQKKLVGRRSAFGRPKGRQ
jgi:hypothetical protein